MALYRKYRSKSLAEVVGQRHVTDILSRAIASGRISHAYLLTGPRGVGKTSVARILAHEINQLPYSDDSTHLDIIEIDAASNNGVEDVRDLREKVQIAPVSASKKVYIIDEVHMLSKAAFNALLKTLEEPPEHIVFILATTDVDKIPATIISRTQRYGFRAITEDDAVTHLRFIAGEENITIDDESLKIIAQRGDGSFRDSISLLDQLASLADTKQGITADLVQTTLGLAASTVVTDLLAAVEAHDVSAVATLLESTTASGISATTLTGQLTTALRSRIIEKPAFLRLLDALLDVPRNSQPDLKLLAVLGGAALDQKPSKSVALASPVLEVTATIAELTKQATRIKPSMPAAKPSAPADNSLPVVASDTVSKGPLESESFPVLKPRKTRHEAGPAEIVPEVSADLEILPEAQDFNWETLVEFARKNYVALYSVLSKCTPELNDTVLTLYTNSAFYKKKLDDQKYSTHLYDSLKSIGSYQLTVHTLPTAPPPKDSHAAAVAAIMGGGEEVAVS
ncbi:DNA polymerase III subunit gamma/tau [Candidatus Saccharibacteria bacterium]|nr:DNA polymerase III subunit gamma/tau [Candidatus Saccharibacteria bacterium]